MEHLITVSSSVSWWRRRRRRQGTIARTMRQLHCHRPQCSNWESTSGTPEQDQKIKFPNWILRWPSPFLPVWKLGSKLPQFRFHREWSPFHRGYAMTMAHIQPAWRPPGVRQTICPKAIHCQCHTVSRTVRPGPLQGNQRGEGWGPFGGPCWCSLLLLLLLLLLLFQFLSQGTNQNPIWWVNTNYSSSEEWWFVGNNSWCSVFLA